MRLIDADALIEKHAKEEKARYGGAFVVGGNRFMQRFMEAPTVDAVEVVRCKDCKHRDPEDLECDCGGLERAGCVFPVADDYFCSYGEREEDDTK